MILKLLTNTKVIAAVVIAIASVIAALALRGAFRKPDIIQETVYSRIEDVKHVRHLNLMTYYFESMIDVTHAEKTDKVYLLMIIPARVGCYIDLEHMTYTLEDSLLRIHLPDPVIEPPVLDLDSARIFNMNQRYVTASKKSYETVVRNVQNSLIRAKADVLNRAEANGIKEEAKRLGEGNIRSILTGLGFQVEFEEMESQNRQQLIEFAKQCIDDTLLSVDGALISMEAGLEPKDTEQMSGYQELMSVRQTLLTSEYGLISVVPTQKAIHDTHKTFKPDQLSGVKALKSITETLKPIVNALKSSTGHTLCTTAVVFLIKKQKSMKKQTKNKSHE